MKNSEASRTTPIVVFIFSLLVFHNLYTFFMQREINEKHDVVMRMSGSLNAGDPLVLETLKKNHLQPPSDLPYNFTPAGEILYHNLNHDSGWKFVHHYTSQIFSDQENGFFIEAGAVDGEYQSNTLWLEKEKAWTGLLIEPDPINFKSLVWKRRKAWISQTCLSSGTHLYETFLESYLDGLGWFSRVNSKTISPSFDEPLEGFVRDRSSLSYSKVSCFPFSSYLQVLNVSTVDFMSLNIQGSEWEVIKSLPLGKVQFRVLAVNKAQAEVNTLDLKFIKFMSRIGFQYLEKDGKHNHIFIVKGDPVFKTNYEPFSKEKFGIYLFNNVMI